MSAVIVYERKGGAQAIDNAMNTITQRYNYIHNKITQKSKLDQLHNQQINKIKQFLSTFNTAYSKYSPVQIENLLRQSVEKNTNGQLSKYLQTIASDSSQLLSKNIQKDFVSSSAARQNILRALGGLYSLYEMGLRKNQISIDAHSFNRESNKLLNSIVQGGLLAGTQSSLPNGLAETGNALGRTGAVAGAILAQNVINDLLNTSFSKAQGVVYDTGAKKITNTNQTVTTDTLVVSQNVSGNTAQIMATLNISDKFNVAYSSTSKSTGRPIKLATRTISSFLKDIDQNNIQNAYEVALLNYLSYHADAESGKFIREDYLKDNIFSGGMNKQGWNSLRRAVGVEMLYSELFGSGKGTFSFQNINVQDKIDLYFYGDKIFFADDIIRSKRKSNGLYRDFNLAQISLAKRDRLLRSANIQSLPRQDILNQPQDQRTTYVQQILSTSTISYSQVVKFS